MRLVAELLESPRERARDGDATLGGMADNTTDGAREIEAGNSLSNTYIHAKHNFQKGKAGDTLHCRSHVQKQVLRAVTWTLAKNIRESDMGFATHQRQHVPKTAF